MSGVAQKWDNSDDALLSSMGTASTEITELSSGTDYYAKIWAVDIFGNNSTVSEAQIKTESSGRRRRPTPFTPILNQPETPTGQATINLSGIAKVNSEIYLYIDGQKQTTPIATTQDDNTFSGLTTLSEGEYEVYITSKDQSQNESQPSTSRIVVVDFSLIEEVETEETAEENNENLEADIINNEEIVAIVDSVEKIKNTEDIEGVVDIEESILSDEQERVENELADDEVDSDDVDTEQMVNESVLIDTKIVMTENESDKGIVFIEAEDKFADASTLMKDISVAKESVILQIPQVVQVANVSVGNSINFSGTGVPNSEVIVFIHSEQAVVYRTGVDMEGNWEFDHSQDDIELEEGDHEVYVMTLDANSKVKSRASVITKFRVEKNYLAVILSYFDLTTTLLTVLVTLVGIAVLLVSKNRQLATNKK